MGCKNRNNTIAMYKSEIVLNSTLSIHHKQDVKLKTHFDTF